MSVEMMRRGLLLEALQDIHTRMTTLTPYYVVSGYFCSYSLCVAVSVLLVSLTLSLSLGGSTTSDSTNFLFRSVTAFMGQCVVFVMACTWLFQQAGGKFVRSGKQEAGAGGAKKQAKKVEPESLVEIVVKKVAKYFCGLFSQRERLRERVAWIVGVSVVAEVGKVASFFSIVALLSLVWCVYLIKSHCARTSRSAHGRCG